MVSVHKALGAGRREALESLVDRLASEIDSCSNAHDRLPLVRAFLAAVGQLDALEARLHRQARAEARSGSYVDSDGISEPLDELLARRKRNARAS